MKRGFTLIEMLVVMGIMGLLGTISATGYLGIRRGMEERAALTNASKMIHAAYQRAQIDRQPVAVFFWNETLKSQTDNDNEVVIGRAVAVRRRGRLSAVHGNRLVDEFGDLESFYPEDDTGANNGETFYLYALHDIAALAGSDELKRSKVRGAIVRASENPLFLSNAAYVTESAGDGSGEKPDTSVPAYAFEVVDAGGIEWKPGTAYGYEFIQFTLPLNYIFGQSYSKDAANSVKSAGVMVFRPGNNSGNGRTEGGVLGARTIKVFSLRQSGIELIAMKVGDTVDPERGEN